MKKIYLNDAERQQAYRERKKLDGFKTVTLMVPDHIYAGIDGKPVKLLETYTTYEQMQGKISTLSDKLRELEENSSPAHNTDDHNKLQITYDALMVDHEILKVEHERSKAEYAKLQDAYTMLKFGDWYARK
jgi:hypothetical protein